MTIHQNLSQEELVLDSVVGGNQDFEETLLLIEGVLLRDLLVPLLELVGDTVDTLLVNVDFGDEIGLLLSDLLLEVNAEFVAVVVVHVGAN